VFLELGLQVPAGLTHIREVAGFTGQTVDHTMMHGQNHIKSNRMFGPSPVTLCWAYPILYVLSFV